MTSRVCKCFAATALVAGAWLGGCSGGNHGPVENADVASLQSALQGHADPETQAAVATLVGVLNAEDWGYLTYAQWPEDDGISAATDPTLQKAAIALAAAMGADIRPDAILPLRPLSSLSETPSANGDLHVLAGLTAMQLSEWLANYPDYVDLMKKANGLNFAGTGSVAADFARLLASAAQASGPLPAPAMPADGVLGACGKSFYDGTTLSPSCSGTDFCCRGEIDFDAGADICVDYTSCRGDETPPLLSGPDAGAAENSDGNGDPCGPSAGGCAAIGLVDATLRPGCCDTLTPCSNAGTLSSCSDSCGYAWYELDGHLYGPCAPGDAACPMMQAQAAANDCN